jgi:hypothetical protein
MTKLIGKTQSLMCTKTGSGMVNVETPNKHVRQFYKNLDVTVPSSLVLKDFISETIHL